MLDNLRILIIPGSLRTGSLNHKLAANAATIAREVGVASDEFDLRSLGLPVYDGDIEATSGIPAGAYELQRAILSSDGVLFVTPEYNGFPTPLVINALDWLSRIQQSEGMPSGLATTANKPAALLSASPGPGGGLRSMNFLRQYLQMAFAMIVAPQQYALGRAHEAFDEKDQLRDTRAAQAVHTVVSSLAALSSALASTR